MTDYEVVKKTLKEDSHWQTAGDVARLRESLNSCIWEPSDLWRWLDIGSVAQEILKKQLRDD